MDRSGATAIESAGIPAEGAGVEEGLLQLLKKVPTIPVYGKIENDLFERLNLEAIPAERLTEEDVIDDTVARKAQAAAARAKKVATDKKSKESHRKVALQAEDEAANIHVRRLKRFFRPLRNRIFPGWEKDRQENIAGWPFFWGRLGEVGIGLIGGLAACFAFWAAYYQYQWSLPLILAYTIVGAVVTGPVEIPPWQEYTGLLLSRYAEKFYKAGRVKLAELHLENRQEASERSDEDYAEGKARTQFIKNDHHRQNRELAEAAYEEKVKAYRTREMRQYYIDAVLSQKPFSFKLAPVAVDAKKAYKEAILHLIQVQKEYILHLETEMAAAEKTKVRKMDEAAKADYAARKAEAVKRLEREKEYLDTLKALSKIEAKRLEAEAAVAVAMQDSFWTRARVWWSQFFYLENVLRLLMWLVVLVNSSSIAIGTAVWWSGFFSGFGTPFAVIVLICAIFAFGMTMGSVSFNKYLIEGVFEDSQEAPPVFLQDHKLKKNYQRAKKIALALGVIAGIAFAALVVLSILTLPWSPAILAGVCAAAGLCIFICHVLVAVGSMQGAIKHYYEIKYQHQILKAKVRQKFEKTLEDGYPNGKAVYEGIGKKNQENLLSYSANMPFTGWMGVKFFSLFLQSANRAFFTAYFVATELMKFSFIEDSNLGPFKVIVPIILGVLAGFFYAPDDFCEYISYLMSKEIHDYTQMDVDDKANVIVQALLTNPKFGFARKQVETAIAKTGTATEAPETETKKSSRWGSFFSWGKGEAKSAVPHLILASTPTAEAAAGGVTPPPEGGAPSSPRLGLVA